MRKYYTRPCNFYYGNRARRLVKNKKALFLAGNPNVAYDRLEIFQRKNKRIIQSNIYLINEIKGLNKEIKSTINVDLKRQKIIDSNYKIVNKTSDTVISIVFVISNIILIYGLSDKIYL